MLHRIAQLSLLAVLSVNALAANDDLDDLRTSNIARDEWRLIKQDRAHDFKLTISVTLVKVYALSK